MEVHSVSIFLLSVAKKGGMTAADALWGLVVLWKGSTSVLLLTLRSEVRVGGRTLKVQNVDTDSI